MTTDSAAVTILKRCDEVMERHYERWIRPDDMWSECHNCAGQWPCDAYANARDLRDAVETLEWYGEWNNQSWKQEEDTLFEYHPMIRDGGARSRAALATIAERRKK